MDRIPPIIELNLCLKPGLVFNKFISEWYECLWLYFVICPKEEKNRKLLNPNIPPSDAFVVSEGYMTQVQRDREGNEVWCVYGLYRLL